MSNKPSLFNATNHLSTLMDNIDSGIDLTADLVKEFHETKENISLAIDRRKYVMAEADSKIDAAKKIINDAKEFIKKIEKVKFKIKMSTLQALKLNPSVVFKDTLGRKVSIRTTPGKVKYNIDVSKTSLSNVIDPDMAKDPELAPYITERTYYVIQNDKVKADLVEGKSIKFASLDKSEYVSGI